MSLTSVSSAAAASLYRRLPRLLPLLRSSSFFSCPPLPSSVLPPPRYTRYSTSPTQQRPSKATTARSYPATATTTPTALRPIASTTVYSSYYHSTSVKMASATSFHDFKPLDKRGQPYDFSQLKGKVVLVVNTASKCGFTPQFGGLETLYKDLKAQYGDSFEILGFPCNQFGSQDPGSNDQIQEFCQLNYGVSFPVLGKVDVNGDKADPVFEWLKAEKPGLLGLKRIKWNFEKFLVGKDGSVKGRWASTTKPESLKDAIVKELKDGKL